MLFFLVSFTSIEVSFLNSSCWVLSIKASFLDSSCWVLSIKASCFDSPSGVCCCFSNFAFWFAILWYELKQKLYNYGIEFLLTLHDSLHINYTFINQWYNIRLWSKIMSCVNTLTIDIGIWYQIVQIHVKQNHVVCCYR